MEKENGSLIRKDTDRMSRVTVTRGQVGRSVTGLLGPEFHHELYETLLRVRRFCESEGEP